MTSALILGTLAGQVDAMQVLQRRGWTVHACGHRREGPGVETSDQFHLVDIVDTEAVTRLAYDLGVDVVYSVGSDIAMPTIAAVSDRLGLPAFHDPVTTETLHRKDLLRRFLERTRLSPVVNRPLAGADDLNGFSTFPAIVKPTDSQGQRGITIVANQDEATAALPVALAASRSGTAVIEEYLDGPEISVHVFVVDGIPRWSLPSDRYVWEGPLVGIPVGHTIPAAMLSEPDRSPVDNLIHRFVSALGVGTGPLYFQLKLTTRGPRIIEVASRLDGCHLWRLIEFHTGFNLIEVCFDMLMGSTWSNPAAGRSDLIHTLHFYLGDPSTPFHAADHRPQTSGRVLYNEYQVDEGELPRDTNGIVSRLGYWIEEQTG